MFGGRAFSPASRSLVTDTVPRIGYGWFRGTNARFGGIAYTMSGRAPGFASYVLYLPRAALTVVVLSNMYSSATSAMGSDLASIVLGLPYSAFHPIAAASADLRGINRQFQFGPDFYQKNAVLTITPSDTGVTLDWPSGDRSALIPLGRDTYVDRSYWQDVHIDRDTGGQPIALRYGEFRGEVIGRPRAGDRR